MSAATPADSLIQKKHDAEQTHALRTFDQDHFITLGCYHRVTFLANGNARDTFEEMLETLREGHQFLIHGYVVMPNHVHLLLSEPKLHLLANTMGVLKTETSKRGSMGHPGIRGGRTGYAGGNAHRSDPTYATACRYRVDYVP